LKKIYLTLLVFVLAVLFMGCDSTGDNKPSTTPTSTPTPVVTETPSQTQTPTSVPMVTEIPEATATPEPTVFPEVTPEVTEEPQPTEEPDDSPKVTVKDVSAPNGLLEGSPFSLKGEISVSQGKLTEINGYIYDYKLDVVIQVTETSKKATYNINKGKVNKQIAFGNLPVGDYRYVVTIKGTYFPEETVVIDRSFTIKQRQSNLLAINSINQQPELPKGSEITCLATVLEFYGITADKCDLADNYLEKGTAGSDSPYQCFIGNPRSSFQSYGCYAPVIVNASVKYLEAMEITGYVSEDISGTAQSMDDYYRYVNKGIPVIMWATKDLVASNAQRTWKTDYGTYVWKSNEHCYVLVGYNRVNNMVSLADPATGKVIEKDADELWTRHQEQYSQAVVVYQLVEK